LSKFEVPRINSKPTSSSDFSFEIHFESEEVPKGKIVRFFKSTFYFNFSEFGKVLFGSVKV
jgi:hypothetical protein